VLPAGAGNPVSASVFKPDQSGNAAFIVEVPPNLPDPGALAVTLEPASGSLGPTMPLYLAGALP
jgi:anti-sigma-K factor RskA